MSSTALLKPDIVLDHGPLRAVSGISETIFWLDLLRKPRTIASQLFVCGSIQPRTMLQTPQPMRKAPT